MAKIKTFNATRYNENKFEIPPVAPPYDIISEKQRANFAANEYHMINLDKPGSEDDKDRYRKANDRLQNWKSSQAMITESEPCYYAYVQKFKHPETGETFQRSGFYGLVKLEEHYEYSIYPHERTLSAPKADRLDLMRATKANLSPVVGMYDDPENKAKAVFEKVKANEPVFKAYVDMDGTEHVVWKIVDSQLQQVLTEALHGKNIIIADGHHRYATALNYRNEMREKNPSEVDEAYDYVLMCLINFNDDGLVILPTHRLFSVEVEEVELVSKLKEFFTIEKKGPEDVEKALLNKLANQQILGVYFGKNLGTYLLSLKKDVCLDGIVPESPSMDWRKLEVNLLFFIVIKKILNLSDSEFQTKITYTHAFKESIDLVDDTDIACAFLLPANTKEELEKVTESHEVMPQKSTYFFPKVFSGFVLYEHI